MKRSLFAACILLSASFMLTACNTTNMVRKSATQLESQMDEMTEKLNKGDVEETLKSLQDKANELSKGR